MSDWLDDQIRSRTEELVASIGPPKSPSSEHICRCEWDPTSHVVPGHSILTRQHGGVWFWEDFYPEGQENGGGYNTECEAIQAAVAWAVWRFCGQQWKYDPAWRDGSRQWGEDLQDPLP